MLEDPALQRLLVWAALAGAAIWAARKIASSGISSTVAEGHRGVVYRHGRFEQELGPGRHWMVFGRALTTVPMNEQSFIVGNQEVMTADRMAVRVTATVTFKVVHARKAIEASADGYLAALYRVAQLALRDVIADLPLEAFIDSRTKLDGKLSAAAAPGMSDYSCELLTFQLRDVVLPAEVRRLTTDVTRARMEAQASLERARGEQASLRSLANAARLLKGNPELMNLRILQAVAAGTGKTPPTIILGSGAGLVPVPSGPSSQPPESEQDG